jgi:phosphatidylserine decarboxylase
MFSAHKEMLRFGIPLALLASVLIFVVSPLLPPAWLILRIVVPLIGFLFALLTLFVTYFFRDPDRAVPSDPHIIVSAADGTVVSIEEMEEPDFHLGPMVRIAVFLSVFDVHVNRSPVAATVKSTIYRKGRFLDARHLDASTLNECRAWWLESDRGPIAVRQIAGLIARRIVAWAEEGSSLERGGRFGMIRFGSRTEVFVPLGSAILVKPGDRVAGAATPIARWPDAP